MNKNQILSALEIACKNTYFSPTIDNDAIVASVEDYTSLTELLKDIELLKADLKENHSELYNAISIPELKSYRKIYKWDYLGFMPTSIFIEDRDWAYYFAGKDKDSEVKEVISNMIDESDDSDEDFSFIEEQLKSNWTAHPHYQFYVNNDFGNLEKIELVCEDITDYSRQSVGASDEILDAYDVKPVLWFCEAKEEYVIAWDENELTTKYVHEIDTNGTSILEDAKTFETAEEAQEFLDEHPDWINCYITNN